MVDYSTTSTSAGSGVMGILLMLIYIAVIVLIIAGLWKTYAKAGKPGWAAIVPIYNIIIMLEIINRPIWWILLFFIPFVNIVVGIIISLDLAKAFGKSVMFAIFGLIIFSPIGLLMLGFGQAKYVGAKR